MGAGGFLPSCVHSFAGPQWASAPFCDTEWEGWLPLPGILVLAPPFPAGPCLAGASVSSSV